MRFLVLGLDRLAHRLVERCQRLLGLAAPDQNPAHGEPGGHVLWVGLECGRQVLSRKVKRSLVLVQKGELVVELRVGWSHPE